MSLWKVEKCEKEKKSEKSILKRRHFRESETLWRKETWM